MLKNDVFNMHTMYGYCPYNVAKENIRYAFSSFTSSTDTEAEKIRGDLTDFLCKNVLGIIDRRSSLVLTSGSEANEIAILLGKKKTNRQLVISSNLSHSSITYAAKKMECAEKKLIVDVSTFQISENELTEYLEANGDSVAMLNVTYGTTQLGTTENFILSKEIQELCRKKDIWIHIDAAFGAFYLHQIESVPPEWQSAFSMADSITIDPYKFVGLPTSGVLILKDEDYRKFLDDEVSYFKGVTTALGTTRSVLPAATSLAIIEHLSLKGLRNLSAESLNKARFIRQELAKHRAEFISDPQNIVVTVKVPDEESLTRRLDALYKSGFYLSSVKIEAPNYKLYGMRIVTTPKKEMSMENIQRFVQTFNN